MKKVIILLFLIVTPHVCAQCPIINTAIQSGEVISYNMYYNWQFIWVKAGTASLSTVRSVYQGGDVYRSSLITRGNGKTEVFFVLRDTLTAYCTTDMVPLYYRKGAREGKYYTVDEAYYSYPDGNCRVDLHRQKNDGTHLREKVSLDNCVYDMLNLFLRARSFDLKSREEGKEKTIDIIDGTKINSAKLICKGKETGKADDGKKYPCLRMSYVEVNKNKEKEIACFFVTDDARHIPVRIDLNLRFGSAKAFLTNMKFTP